MVLVALVVALVAGVIFFALQARGEHPMVPLGLFRPAPQRPQSRSGSHSWWASTAWCS
jgi:hypothetical protein